MKMKTFLLAELALSLLLTSCALPQGLLPPTPGLPLPTASPEALPSPTFTALPTDTPLPATQTPAPALPTATLLPTETQVPAPTLSPTPIDFPTITFKTNANCRLGPSTNYNQVTNFLTDRAATAEGRNRDSSWLWVKASTGNCWVNVATIKDPVDFTFLPLVPFAPLPEAPSRLNVIKLECAPRTAITLRWPDVTGETGYTLYRDGITIFKFKADSTEYIDFPPLDTEYLYEIESYNDVGISVRYGQTVLGCKK